ncbi:hypothetical protein PAAG_04303 [Paracoccidioides lutzii Pb01]|uniref:DUF4246 domain-containing protein n=1 Tax=Paracoccidioides lutzii (strain ATCC MYA-826 / Pb01) TaxID=502779 RepID=C1H0K9_PARBA|nr:hypothetical protein PAAG_04303 [Paracoccidioides lutzii Pb01]EEH33250.2 hypothetical protein PAAG_04303 [Paracoccidioides lutzii Pb01]
MLRWIIAELSYKTELLKESGCVVVFDITAIKSGIAVSESTWLTLKPAITALEDEKSPRSLSPRFRQQSRQPRAPSSIPCSIWQGAAHILRDVGLDLGNCLQEPLGRDEVMPAPMKEEAQVPFLGESDRHHYLQSSSNWKPFLIFTVANFQWLPCDVNFVGQFTCKIVAYASNLHLQHHVVLFSNRGNNCLRDPVLESDSLV